MVKVGLLTIGQSPRVDVLTDWGFDLRDVQDYKPMETLTPPANSAIPPNIEFVHIGALDNIPREKIHEIQPPTGKGGAVSRLRDGSWTNIDGDKLNPLMQKCVNELERSGCDAIVQLCTGDFPYLKPKCLYLRPGRLDRGIIETMLPEDGKLGIFGPSSSPLTHARAPRWGNREVYSVGVNPYEGSPESKIPTIKEFKGKVDLAYMGCIGYSLQHRKVAREILNVPVIIPRLTCLKVLQELYGA